MTLSVTHTFQSLIADDPVALAAGEVCPQSHWNAAHTVTGTLPAANIAAGGPTTAVQVNNSNVLYGDSNLTFTGGANGTLTIGSSTVGVPIYSPASDTGGNSLAIGRGALGSQITSAAYQNIAIGAGALSGALTTAAIQNVAIGFNTLAQNTTGYANLAIGYSALNQNTVGLGNIAIGSGALELSAGANVNYNTAIGAYALYNSSANYNVAIGFGALYYNTSGIENVAIGYTALELNTSGNTNFAMGSQALLNNVTGSDNIAIGWQALYHSTLSANVGIGSQALWTSVGNQYCTGVGFNVLYSTTGSENTAIGYTAGYYITTGINNTIIGAHSGLGITTGSYNTIIGSEVTGLSSSLANSIILSDGQGNIRYDYGYTTASTTTIASALNITGTTTVAGSIEITPYVLGQGLLVADSGGTLRFIAGYNLSATLLQVGPRAGTTTSTVIYGGGTSGLSVDASGNVIIPGTTTATGVITHSAAPKFAVNSTGSTTVVIGTNSPATLASTAPYTWFTMTASDGTTVYVPGWK